MEHDGRVEVVPRHETLGLPARSVIADCRSGERTQVWAVTAWVYDHGPVAQGGEVVRQLVLDQVPPHGQALRGREKMENSNGKSRATSQLLLCPAVGGIAQ